MSSVDMCEHEWPGSGCKECKARATQQSSPKEPEEQKRPRYICHKCKQETKPPKPFEAYVLCDCGYMTAATTALARPAEQGEV